MKVFCNFLTFALFSYGLGFMCSPGSAGTEALAWKDFSPKQRGILSQLLDLSSNEAEAANAFQAHLTSYRDNPCPYPFTRLLFEDWGKQQDLPRCDPGITVPVESYELAARGRSLFFENLDFRRVRAIFVGVNKDSKRVDFGHSFIKIDLCPSADFSTCSWPLEIVVSPGSDKEKKIHYGFRTFSDVLSAMASRPGLKTTMVELPFAPKEKRNFILALIEKSRLKAVYKVLSRNCATSIRGLVNVATDQVDDFIDPRPFSMLEWVAKKFSSPLIPVPSYVLRANIAMSQSSVKRGFGLISASFAEYLHLPNERRFCSLNNPKGILKTLAELIKNPAQTESKKSPYASTCEERTDAVVRIFNLASACSMLEEQVEFAIKSALNKEIMDERREVHHSPDHEINELSHLTHRLDMVRFEQIALLGELKNKVETLAGGKIPADRYGQTFEDFGATPEGKKYTTLLKDKLEISEKLAKKISGKYVENLRKHAGSKPIELMKRVVGMKGWVDEVHEACK